MQRGVGNTNPMKMAKCIMELERIYGIKNGGDRKSEGQNVRVKTQSELADEIGINERQLRRYKELLKLIPELQDLMVGEGKEKIKPSIAYNILAKL